MDLFITCQLNDGSCSSYNSSYKDADQCVILGSLKTDIGHLFDADMELKEYELIEMRSVGALDINKPICPKHRYCLGQKFRPSALCKYNSDCKRKGINVKWDLFKLIRAQNPKFVLGSMICKPCRASIPKQKDSSDCSYTDDDKNDLRDLDFLPDASLSSESDFQKCREALDCLTDVLNVPRISFQITKNVNELSSRTMRYIRQIHSELQVQLTETLAHLLGPGQEEEIKKIFSTKEPVENSDTNQLQTLKDAYLSCKDYRAKMSVLTLVPKNISKKTVCEFFTCNEYEIRRARQILKEYGPCARVEPEKRFYSRMSIDKAVHYIDFLFSSGLLQEQAYGNSKIKFSTGETEIVGSTILNGVFEHAIHEYVIYCKEVSYPHLGVSTLRSILNSMKIKARQKIAGVDSFIVYGLESFEVTTLLIFSLL